MSSCCGCCCTCAKGYQQFGDPVEVRDEPTVVEVVVHLTMTVVVVVIVMVMVVDTVSWTTMSQ